MLSLHLPHVQRSSVRVDAVHGLQNDRAVWALQSRGQGMMRDAWFHPYPTDDTDTVCKEGFKSIPKGPLRFGLYFMEQDMPPGKGQIMKLVLCKICVGNSVCRSEGDATDFTRAPPGYDSLYIPGNQSTELSVFNDTYILYDSALAVPTHVISYHFEASQMSNRDEEAIRWVNKKSQQLLGFSEAQFSHFLMGLAQNADSVTALRSRLRDQADVPAAVADALAEALYSRVPKVSDATTRGQVNNVSKSSITDEVPVDPQQLAEVLGMFDLDDSCIDGATIHEACHCITQDMVQLDEAVEDLQATMKKVEDMSETFDEHHFERADKFRQELVAQLKEHMLTLQVAEERRQELLRAIDEGNHLSSFFGNEQMTRTKVALLTQWKNLESLRNNLKIRFQNMSNLPSQILTSASLTEDDELSEMERHVLQKDRVVDILVQRLRSCGADLTPNEEELLALASV